MAYFTDVFIFSPKKNIESMCTHKESELATGGSSAEESIHMVQT